MRFDWLAGARVILACRDVAKAEAARNEINDWVGDNCEVVVKRIDLSSLRSVREFAEDVIKSEIDDYVWLNIYNYSVFSRASMAVCSERWRSVADSLGGVGVQVRPWPPSSLVIDFDPTLQRKSKCFCCV